MTTRNLVPQADKEGGIGTALKRWLAGFFKNITLISDNSEDGTGRLQLSSYERTVYPTHYGENIRIDWKAVDAKACIAFRDESGNSKAWLVAHKYLGPGSATLHQHFSIETSKADGSLHTRMAFPWDFDICEIGVYDANININTGKLRLVGENGVNKEVQFGLTLSSEIAPDGSTIRWGIRQDTTTESGSNVGSDLKIVRYTDSGVAIDNPLCIKRSNGYVVVGGAISDATSPFTVASDKIRVKTAKTPASAADTGVAGEIAWDSSYIYVCVATNTWKRVSISTW